MTEVIRIWNDHIDNNCKKTYRRINILINKLSSFCWNNDSLFFVWNRRICAHDLDYTSLLWKSRRIFFNAAFFFYSLVPRECGMLSYSYKKQYSILAEYQLGSQFDLAFNVGHAMNRSKNLNGGQYLFCNITKCIMKYIFVSRGKKGKNSLKRNYFNNLHNINTI